MHFLVEERVLGTLRQHDLQVEGHYVATAVVDHHKDHLAISNQHQNELANFAATAWEVDCLGSQ